MAAPPAIEARYQEEDYVYSSDAEAAHGAEVSRITRGVVGVKMMEESEA